MNTRAKHTGMTLAEILMAMAIIATLLASVAVAMKASLSSYKANDEMAAVTQTARSILSRMDREIRTAEDVNWSSNTLTILPALDGSGLTQVQYVFQNGVLSYKRTVNGTTTAYPLLDSTDRVSLTSFTASPVSGLNANSQPCTVSMTTTLTFRIGDQTFSVTSSAAPRRNQRF
ncbi:MAG: PilW family protein [Phycisphaerae bacterium]